MLEDTNPGIAPLLNDPGHKQRSWPDSQKIKGLHPMLEGEHCSVDQPGIPPESQLLPGQHPAAVEELFTQDIENPPDEIHGYDPPLALNRHAKK